jgi:hypothetical protein
MEEEFEKVKVNRLSPDIVRSLLQAGMKKGAWSHSVQLPELKHSHAHSEIFTTPYFLWLPELNRPKKLPYCVKCKCTLRVKDYKQRVVEDVNHRTNLLYVSYECTGKSKETFTTISKRYFDRNGADFLRFPYILTHKFGISKDLYEFIHDGQMSPYGK